MRSNLLGHQDFSFGEMESSATATLVRMAPAIKPEVIGSSKKREVRIATKTVFVPRRGVAWERSPWAKARMAHRRPIKREVPAKRAPQNPELLGWPGKKKTRGADHPAMERLERAVTMRGWAPHRSPNFSPHDPRAYRNEARSGMKSGTFHRAHKTGNRQVGSRACSGGAN